MYSRRGFLRKLRKLSRERSRTIRRNTPSGHVDRLVRRHYSQVRRDGQPQPGECSARAIHRAVGENAVSAYLGEGRFATLLVGQSPAAAKSVAESLAKDFGSRESHHDSIPRPTLTSAVVPWTAGNKADGCLGRGAGNAAIGGNFGRRLRRRAWRIQQGIRRMAGGDVDGQPVHQRRGPGHHGTVSRADRTRCRAGELADALERAGVAVRPYVDREGRLVGVAADEDAAAETRNRPTGEHLAMPETIAHDASFPEIYEAFSSRGCSTLVVTADDHPLGYLTCDGFLSMIDPITTESFAHTDKSADELTYFAVPSTLKIAEAAEAVGS